MCVALLGNNHKAKQGNCLLSYVLYKLTALNHFLGRYFFSLALQKNPNTTLIF